MDPIADVEGAISNAQLATLMGQMSVALGQLAIADAQGALLQQEYLAALPIIALEFRGLVSIIIGSGELFVGTLESLAFFIPNFFNGIFALFTFSASWMMCLFKNISNMQTCLFYYLLEVAGQILYLPFRLFLWVAYKVGFNFYPMETGFWNGIEYIDSIFMNYFGFHISHYPKNIREQCYNCKRLKISALINRSAPLVTDVTERLPSKLMPGIMRIAKGGHQLMNPFG